MSCERHERIAALFLEVCDLPASERSQRLDERCGEDLELKNEILGLLEHHHPAPLHARPGVVLAGRYRLDRALGTGSEGEVFLAQDLELATPVAIKWLSRTSADRERLRREVRLARRVRHPGVCRVHDLGEADGNLFLTMEVMEGEDAASLLRRAGRLSPEKVKDLAHQLCAALAAAHAAGVLHRDLKPANLLIDDRGRLRILDFGIALEAREGRSGWVLPAGTPGYAAPEQTLPGLAISEATDVYGAALVIFEWLVGSKLEGKVEERPDLVRGALSQRGLDERWGHALAEALSPDPKRRLPSILHLANALPGIDPLAVAVDAGVSPPPDLLAESRDGRVLGARAVTGLALFSLAAIFFLPLAADHSLGLSRKAPQLAPQAVVQQAKALFDALGLPPGEERAGFFEPPFSPPEGRVETWVDRRWLVDLPSSAEGTLVADPPRWPSDPPEALKHQAVAFFDGAGRLRLFTADPPLGNARSVEDPWASLLEAAGEKRANGRPPPSGEGALWFPQEGDSRFEVSAIGGIPVYFALSPGIETERRRVEQAQRVRLLTGLLLAAIVLASLVSAPLAVRAWSIAGADRRLVLKLAVFLVVAEVVTAILATSVPGHPLRDGGGMLASGLLSAWLIALLVAGWYLALEPLARRWWPHSLVAWSHLWQGRWADRKAAAAVLVGLAAGLAKTYLDLLDRHLASRWVAEWLPNPGEAARQLAAGLDLTSLALALVGGLPTGLIEAILAFFLLVVAARWLRPGIRAYAAFVVVWSGLGLMTGAAFQVSWATVGLGTALLSLVVLRISGLASLAVAAMLHTVLLRLPLMQSPPGWLSEPSNLPLWFFALLVILTAWRSRSA